MTAPITRFVTITLALAATAVGSANFSTPLIGAYTDAWTGNAVRSYQSLTEVAVDFPATGVGSAVYNAANVLWSQTGAPQIIKVARLGAAVVSTSTLKISAAQGTGFVWTVNVCGIDLVYTEAPADTTALIAAGLVTAATAYNATFTANVTSPTDTVNFARVAKNADLPIIRAKAIAEISVLTATETFGTAAATALTAVQAIDNDFYGVCLAQNTEAQIKSAGSWVDAQEKLYAYCNSDGENKATGTTGLLFYDMKASAYKRAIGFFHDTASDQHVDAAYLGVVLGLLPGTYTGTFKALTGVPVDDLSTTNSGYIIANNGNTYEYWMGTPMTNGSLCSSGINQDTITLADKLKNDIQVEIGLVYVNNPKIAFTDDGIDMIVNAIKKPLNFYLANGGLATTPSALRAPWVTAPKAVDVSSAKKLARTLPSIKFGAYLAGAIEHVEISGVLTV